MITDISNTGGFGGDQLGGGAGADTITGSGNADFLYSSDIPPRGGTVDDMGLEHDRLAGGAGDDILNAGYGDDVDGGAGQDTLHLSLGGLGHGLDFDTSIFKSGAPVSLGGGTIQNVEALVYLRGTEFDDILRLATQATTLTVNAGAGNDLIIADGSAVSVMGGAGDDRLMSGTGSDSFDGGAGADTIDYSGAPGAVSVNLHTGVGAGGDSLISVEAVIGSAFADTLIGSEAGSTLAGGAGADTLEMGAKDVAVLGAGADLVQVLAGSHSASAQAAAITDTDWTAEDRLQFGSAAGAYVETTAPTYAIAVQAAESEERAGYDFVSVQVGSDASMCLAIR